MAFHLYLYIFLIGCVSASNIIKQIAYISCSTDISGFTEENINSILRASTDYNHRHGITGVLLYHEKQAFQLLEGETLAIDNVMHKILLDTRHKNVIMLLSRQIHKNDRSFNDWDMVVRNIDTIKTQSQILNTHDPLVKRLLGIYRFLLFKS